MNIRVVYYSGRSGNTMKVAEAIAEAVGVRAEKAGKKRIVFSEPVGLLIVGSGIYFHKPHKKVSSLIKGLDSSAVKNAAAFGTYGNQSDIGVQISELLRAQGINVSSEPFVCKGASIGTDNRGHPDAEDIDNAKAFANNVASGIKMLYNDSI